MSYRSACCVLYMQFIYKVCAHEHHHVNHITPNTSAVLVLDLAVYVYAHGASSLHSVPVPF